jgi:hypothetical protein
MGRELMIEKNYIYDEGGQVVGFGTEDFSVRTIPRKTATEIIIANHYSKKIYSAARIHLGVFSPELLGCLQFGAAMNPRSQASIVADTEFEEYLELNRMWLDDVLPRNSESKAISYAVALIRKLEPRVGWIQSFSDERCRRFGVVYQAANFEYCGKHKSVFWELDGEMFHNSILTDGLKATQPKGAKLRANRERLIRHEFWQFRYIYFIRPEFRRRLLKKTFPYPKHAPEGSEVIRHASSLEGRVQIPPGARS